MDVDCGLRVSDALGMSFVLWFEAAGAIASFALIATALTLVGRAARTRNQPRHVSNH